MALLLGYDVGSSSIKATLMDAGTGNVLASATSPDKELEIVAAEIGWAEQKPSVWWEHVVKTTQKINAQAKFDAGDVAAIGISYQMHGLVVVDENKNVLRPSIIWCDSRAVEIGEQAARDIGCDKCLKKLFNLPGNFTASKLKWVKDNEPELYENWALLARSRGDAKEQRAAFGRARELYERMGADLQVERLDRECAPTS
jgi:xylulokinase